MDSVCGAVWRHWRSKMRRLELLCQYSPTIFPVNTWRMEAEDGTLAVAADRHDEEDIASGESEAEVRVYDYC